MVKRSLSVTGALKSFNVWIVKNKYILLAISVSAVLHLYKLSSIPGVVFTDEIDPFVSTLSLLQHNGLQLASQPYSILNLLVITLNFEWQSILLLGSNTLAIRFPGVLFSVLLIIGTYFLSKELINDEKVALWASFLVSIAPVIVQGGRVFYQIPLVGSSAFLASGLYLMISGQRLDSIKRILLGSLLLAFDIAGYMNIFSRLVAASMLFVLVVQYFLLSVKKPFRLIRIILVSVVPLAITGAVVLVPPVFSPAAASSSVHQSTFYINSSTNLLFQGVSGLMKFVWKYIMYFSPQFLFLYGGINPTQNTLMTGEFLFPSLFFFYFGLFVIIKKIFNKERANHYALLLFWLFITPVEGAASVVVNYTDSSNIIASTPAIAMITSIGILQLLRSISNLRCKNLINTLQNKKSSLSIDSFERQHLTSGNQNSKKYKAIFLALVVMYSVSGGYFAYAYYDVHSAEVENTPPTWADWGYLYGFPQIAKYIVNHNLTSENIYVSPDGLYGNNLTNFYYFYNVQHIPLSYLDYYSNGKITAISGVINVNSFYPPKNSLIITGSYNDFLTLQHNGVAAKDIYNVTSPNGRVAKILIETNDSVKPYFSQKLGKSSFHINYANSTSTFYVSSFNNISGNFSVAFNFSIPNQNYSPNVFYEFIGAQQNITPRFGFRISSLSYSPLNGSNRIMTLDSYLYSDVGNYSNISGAFDQIWSRIDIIPGVFYFVGLTYSINTYVLYVNGTQVAAANLSYPLEPFQNPIVFDGSFNAIISDFYIWNYSLSPVEMNYQFYNGGGK